MLIKEIAVSERPRERLVCYIGNNYTKIKVSYK